MKMKMKMEMEMRAATAGACTSTNTVAGTSMYPETPSGLWCAAQPGYHGRIEPCPAVNDMLK